MNEAQTLSCPACGGGVPAPLASRKTRCAFCGRTFYYAGGDFLPAVVVPPRLSEADLRASAADLMGGFVAPRDLSRKALLLGRRRLYLPFYLLTGKRGGVLETGRERVVNEREFLHPWQRLGAMTGDPDLQEVVRPRRPAVVVEEDSRVVLGDFRYFYPAVSLHAWDFSDADVKETVLRALETAEPADLLSLSGTGEVVDANIPLETVLEKGVASPTSSAGELKVLAVEATLVYVPVASLTFRYGSQVFHAVVEEVSGRWLSGTMPFRRDLAVMGGSILVGLLGLLTGQFLRGLAGAFAPDFASPGGGSAAWQAVAVLLGVLGALVALGLDLAWAFVRTPFLVRITGTGIRVEAAAEVPPSPLDPVRRGIWAMLKSGFGQDRAPRWLE
ncbi:MAG: hypothetical protein AB1347_01045 [Acidobacteriota bacterium]